MAGLGAMDLKVACSVLGYSQKHRIYIRTSSIFDHSIFVLKREACVQMVCALMNVMLIVIVVDNLNQSTPFFFLRNLLSFLYNSSTCQVTYFVCLFQTTGLVLPSLLNSLFGSLYCTALFCDIHEDVWLKFEGRGKAAHLAWTDEVK